jgi:DNA-binding XRE family transcriptional regulator
MPTLRDLRERILLSQGELAHAVGVHHETVYSWESGRKTPRHEYRRKLAEVFRCTPEELLAAIQETKAARERREQQQENERPAA